MIGVIALAILIGVGVWAYFATRPQPYRVAKRDIVRTVELQGHIIVPPSARADVTTQYSAPVERVNATVGQKVSKGDILVELYYPSIEAARAQAQQRVKAAETAAANAKKQYDQQVQQAQQQLAQAQQNVRQAQTPLGAQETTPGSGGAAGGSAGQPISAGSGAPPQSGGVQSPSGSPAPDPAQAQANEQAARQALQQAVSERQAAVAPYQQQLDAARAAMKQANAGARAANITAPISGTVLALNAQPGQTLSGNGQTTVATIVDLGALQVAADVDADQLDHIKPGMDVTVTVPDFPDQQFTGKIARITTRESSTAAGLIHSRQYVALVDFTNTKGLIRPDMTAHAAVLTQQKTDVVAVPNDAVQTDGEGRPTVTVMRNGAWQKVPVQTGVRGNDYTQIVSGVSPGETIRVTPNLVNAGPR